MTLQEIIAYHSQQSGKWAALCVSSANSRSAARWEEAARFHRSAADHLQELAERPMVAWMDDGKQVRNGSHGFMARLVTAETKVGMHASLSKEFSTPLCVAGEVLK